MAPQRDARGRFVSGGGGGSSGIVWTDRSLFRKVQAAPAAVHAMISQVMEYEANDAQNNMRTGAPWTDRTGNARQGLFARSGSTAGKHYIVLYHTMPYGFWLEVKHAAKYAIITPSIQPVGQSVMRSLQGLFRLLP